MSPALWPCPFCQGVVGSCLMHPNAGKASHGKNKRENLTSKCPLHTQSSHFKTVFKKLRGNAATWDGSGSYCSKDDFWIWFSYKCMWQLHWIPSKTKNYTVICVTRLPFVCVHVDEFEHWALLCEPASHVSSSCDPKATTGMKRWQWRDEGRGLRPQIRAARLWAWQTLKWLHVCPVRGGAFRF